MNLLPKIELHAHLNGSLSEKTLKTLGCMDANINEYQKLTKLLNKTDKTLDDCFQLFKVAQNATSTKESLYLATQDVIKDFFDDNVIYLELRTTPRAETGMTKRDYIETVVKAIRDNQLDIIVKLILSIDRRHDAITSKQSMDIIIEMKNKHADIIKGVDLSGNPNVGSFDSTLFNHARNNGLRTTIHCAEIKNDREVADMLNFRPDRIGHGTFLHPSNGGTKEIWELYTTLKIPLECCLTSNVICGTVKNYKDHHLQEWIKNQLPFSLNTDDKGVFCTTLSQEYIIAINHFKLTDEDLWNISYNSVDHSFASEEEKSILRRKLKDYPKM